MFGPFLLRAYIVVASPTVRARRPTAKQIKKANPKQKRKRDGVRLRELDFCVSIRIGPSANKKLSRFDVLRFHACCFSSVPVPLETCDPFVRHIRIRRPSGIIHYSGCPLEGLSKAKVCFEGQGVFERPACFHYTHRFDSVLIWNE